MKNPAMEYRKFGQTGIEISAIGIGCWEIGGGYGSIEEAEFIKAVNRALDLGINCFDTAEAYGFGASERSLAKALGARRKEATVVTKFGVGYKEAPNFRDSSRQRVIASIEKSLQNLNTDYVDVYMVHWPARRGRMGGINLFQTLFGPEYFPRNLRAVEELKVMAARYHKSLPQFALRWTTSNPVVSVALVGCRNVAEVEDNVGALGWSIAEADMKEIDALFARHGVETMPDMWLERDCGNYGL